MGQGDIEGSCEAVLLQCWCLEHSRQACHAPSPSLGYSRQELHQWAVWHILVCSASLLPHRLHHTCYLFTFPFLVCFLMPSSPRQRPDVLCEVFKDLWMLWVRGTHWEGHLRTELGCFRETQLQFPPPGLLLVLPHAAGTVTGNRWVNGGTRVQSQGWRTGEPAPAITI